MSCAPLPEVPTLHAWVDESLIQRPGARAYLLAGVLADISRVDELRSTLRSLRTGNEAKLHWRAEDHRRRTKLACAVAELHVASIVVVGTPMDRPERARRKCMEALLPRLQSAGAQRVWREARTPTQDRLDREHVAAMVGRGFIPSTFRVQSQQPNQEPMLWLPDVVAGAVNAAQQGHRAYLEALSATVEVVYFEIQ